MLYYVLISPNTPVSQVLDDSGSSNFFDVCKYLCDNDIFFSIGVFNDSQLDNDKFNAYMKDPNILIFPADFSTEWCFL